MQLYNYVSLCFLHKMMDVTRVPSMQLNFVAGMNSIGNFSVVYLWVNCCQLFFFFFFFFFLLFLMVAIYINVKFVVLR